MSRHFNKHTDQIGKCVVVFFDKQSRPFERPLPHWPPSGHTHPFHGFFPSVCFPFAKFNGYYEREGNKGRRQVGKREEKKFTNGTEFKADTHNREEKK